MSDYQELLKQREALDAKIREARQIELKDAIAQARTLVTQFELSVEDVFGHARANSGRANKGAGTKVPAKYRDPATGLTWTGRGKAPRWIADQDREQFLIA
jgi:DNA-binding protein H-NS